MYIIRTTSCSTARLKLWTRTRTMPIPANSARYLKQGMSVRATPLRAEVITKSWRVEQSVNIPPCPIVYLHRAKHTASHLRSSWNTCSVHYTPLSGTTHRSTRIAHRKCRAQRYSPSSARTSRRTPPPTSSRTCPSLRLWRMWKRCTLEVIAWVSRRVRLSRLC